MTTGRRRSRPAAISCTSVRAISTARISRHCAAPACGSASARTTRRSSSARSRSLPTTWRSARSIRRCSRRCRGRRRDSRASANGSGASGALPLVAIGGLTLERLAARFCRRRGRRGGGDRYRARGAAGSARAAVAARRRRGLTEGSRERSLCTPDASCREVGTAGQARLRAASVLVVGAGGLGCAVLPYLAAAGVGPAHRHRSRSRRGSRTCIASRSIA